MEETSSTEFSSPDGELLTPEELAKILRVPTSWIYSHQSQLPTIHVGRYLRFRRTDVDQFLLNKLGCNQ